MHGGPRAHSGPGKRHYNRSATVFAECEGVVQNQITIISEANERAEQTKQNATMRANQYVTDARIRPSR